MRRVIAAAMARSKREIPALLSRDDHRHAAKRWTGWPRRMPRRPVTKRLLYTRVAAARRRLGVAGNAGSLTDSDVDDAFKPANGIHIGVAISLRQGGLINPAIHDVDKKNLDELMEYMLDLVNRARTGHLRSSELSDGTDHGHQSRRTGCRSVFGVIYPPQVALVGFGKVGEWPVAVQGLLGSSVIDATLAADHRVSDGHRGGRFLIAVDTIAAGARELWQGIENGESRIENSRITRAAEKA